MSRWYEACMWGHSLPVFLLLFCYTLSCTLLPGSMVSALAHERFCSCFDCVRSTMGCLSGSTRPPSTCWSWWTPTLHGGKDGCRSLREMLPSPIPLCQGILHSSGVKHIPLKKCDLLLRMASYLGSSLWRMSADMAVGCMLLRLQIGSERLCTII